MTTDGTPAGPGALARWHAELRTGRTVTTFDLLWSAASAEQLGREYSGMGLPQLADQYYVDAALFLARYGETAAARTAVVLPPTPVRHRAPLVPSW